MTTAATAMEPITSSGYLSGGAAMVVVGAGLLAFAALFAHTARASSRLRRLHASAAASFQPDAPYVPGPIVLHGRVALAVGAERAVRVEVTQDGKEEQNDQEVWSHSWRETGRRVLAEPFYLVDAGGRRTRVEPDEKVLLVDTLNSKAYVTLTQRICSAELTPGEEVWASGELVSAPDPEADPDGYRSRQGAGLVLRAAEGQRMLLSSEPLAARFEAKATLHRRWAFLLGFASLLAYGCFFGTYFYSLAAGERIEATVTRLDHFTTKDRGEDQDRVSEHYQVTFTLPGESESHEGALSKESFARLHVNQPLPVRRVASSPSLITIGPDAELGPLGLVIFLLPAWSILAILYSAQVQSSLGWYEKTVFDSGPGRLTQPL